MILEGKCLMQGLVPRRTLLVPLRPGAYQGDWKPQRNRDFRQLLTV
jgi:hypothetical protein